MLAMISMYDKRAVKKEVRFSCARILERQRSKMGLHIEHTER